MLAVLEAKHKPNNKFICDCTGSHDDENDDGAVDGIVLEIDVSAAVVDTVRGTDDSRFECSNDANNAALECNTRCGDVASIKQCGFELNSKASVMLSI